MALMKYSKLSEKSKAWFSLALGILFFALTLVPLIFAEEEAGILAATILVILVFIGLVLVDAPTYYLAASILKLKTKFETALKTAALIIIIGGAFAYLTEVLPLGTFIEFVVGVTISTDIIRRLYKLRFKKAILLLLLSVLVPLAIGLVSFVLLVWFAPISA